MMGTSETVRIRSVTVTPETAGIMRSRITRSKDCCLNKDQA